MSNRKSPEARTVYVERRTVDRERTVIRKSQRLAAILNRGGK